MNSLYNCSWIKNTTLIKEQYNPGDQLLNEQRYPSAGMLRDIMKKCDAAKIGTPYRDARLFLYRFLCDTHWDKIPLEDREKYETIRPTGPGVNMVIGKMCLDEKLPVDFFRKMEKELKEYAEEIVYKDPDNPEKNQTRLVAFLNELVSGREWRGVPRGGDPKSYPTPAQIKAAVQTGVAKKDFEPGTSAYETLVNNLHPLVTLKYILPGMHENDIYQVKLGKYKYRINLKGLKGKDIQMKDVRPENVTHVSVYDTEAEPDVVEMPSMKGPGKRIERPARIYSGETEDVDFNKLPEDEGDDNVVVQDEGDIDFGETGEYARYYSPERPDYEEEEESQNDDMNKLAPVNRPSEIIHHAPNVPEKEVIVVKMSPQAVNRQLANSYRRRQQMRFGMDQKHGLGF